LYLNKKNFLITAFKRSVRIEVTDAYKNAVTGINAYLIPHAARSESLSGIGVNHLASQYRTMLIVANEMAKILENKNKVCFIEN
jgi:hypothetical protein